MQITFSALSRKLSLTALTSQPLKRGSQVTSSQTRFSRMDKVFFSASRGICFGDASEEQIKQLHAALRSNNSATFELYGFKIIAPVLGTGTAEAIQTLEPFLRPKYPYYKKQLSAISVIAEVYGPGTEQAKTALTTWLHAENIDFRRAAIPQIADVYGVGTPEAIEALERGLVDLDKHNRTLGIKLLSKVYGDDKDRAKAALANRLNPITEPYEFARAEAVKQIAVVYGTGTKEAKEALAVQLTDTSYFVREEAVKQIAVVFGPGTKEAKDALENRLNPQTEMDLRVRETAIRNIAAVYGPGTQEAKDALENRLTKEIELFEKEQSRLGQMPRGHITNSNAAVHPTVWQIMNVHGEDYVGASKLILKYLDHPVTKSHLNKYLSHKDLCIDPVKIALTPHQKWSLLQATPDKVENHKLYMAMHP